MPVDVRRHVNAIQIAGVNHTPEEARSVVEQIYDAIEGVGEHDDEGNRLCPKCGCVLDTDEQENLYCAQSTCDGYLQIFEEGDDDDDEEAEAGEEG
jgi:hypothetical protein